MITVAVVEDDPCDQEALRRFIEEAAAGLEEQVDIALFADGLEFIEAYPRGVDMVFLDIDMPGLNGVETARRMRAIDQDACLVFVTNMYQFALEGYEVRALDFLVKPLRYGSFVATFKRAVDAIQTRTPRYVELAFDKTTKLVDVRSILYVETQQKRLLVHTRHGIERCNGPLKDLERRLVSQGFASIHQSYLVNLRYVEHVSQTEVVVAGTALPLSRYRRRDFVQALTAYVGAAL